jgi:DNA mismatch repair protein MutS
MTAESIPLGARSAGDRHDAPDGEARPVRVPFASILFDSSVIGTAIAEPKAPDFFPDLALDRIVASITAGRSEYGLVPFFHAPLKDPETITYRHEVFRDLDNAVLLESVRSFSAKMRSVRGHIAHAAKAHYGLDQQRWFLAGAGVYCGAVAELADALTVSQVPSRGLRALRQFLAAYTASSDFTTLLADTQQTEADLGRIRYRLHISGRRIRVDRYDGGRDYGAEVLQSFERFKQGTLQDRFESRGWFDMNHVEAAILDRVAQLYPGVFASLDRYCQRHAGYVDETVARFDREVQFYIAYLEYMEGFRQAGLAFCYPTVTDRSKEIRGRGVFDLALAQRLADEDAPVVTNDFYLAGPERILVVSGPNQGGKTTFARTIGQICHLAGIGCPVPGVEARIFLVDRIFAHFEREEGLQDLSGKLENDLRRIHEILEHATSDSLLVMNESFGSTTLSDALFLNKEVLRLVIERDMLGVAVTFLDELASLSEKTVSMVSTVDPDDPAVRTFRIVRRPADGLAYAWAIARKHRLTFEGVIERIAP